MTDYLIEKYNKRMSDIQDREAKDLAGALEIYSNATRTIVERHAMERVDASAELAASMSQRDHEYQNGRPAVEPEKAPALPRLPEAKRPSFLHEVAAAISSEASRESREAS